MAVAPRWQESAARWSSITAMQEFSSVTASSYDADSLTPLLNERAADGWSVVSIVSAGTNIVAYLTRERDDAGEVGAGEVGSGEVDAGEVDSTPTYDDVAAEETPVTATEEAPAPVDEPAGWATEPETDTATGDASLAALAAQVAADEPAASETVVSEAAVSEPAEPALAQSAPESAPTPEPAVPAGWYADPSGRFELRYWDGTAWTEHVSRQGQQFTDPPVA
jgi:hypothetical protein